jgi:hypothetical protein
MVPCGPVVGFHVASLHCLAVGKILCDSTGVEIVTSGRGEELWQGRATSLPMVVLNTYCLN